MQFLDQYKIKVTISTGHEILYDMQTKVDTARFQALKDQTVFEKGKLTDRGIISWDDQVELSLEEIILNLTGRNRRQ